MRTASQISKEAGLPSLKVVSEISGISTQTLNNWLENKEFVFYAVIEKASREYKKMNHNDQVVKIAEALAVKALSKIGSKKGYDAGEIVYRYFATETDHPHAKYTFDQMAMNRDMAEDGTTLFAEELAKEMSWRVTENQELAEEI